MRFSNSCKLTNFWISRRVKCRSRCKSTRLPSSKLILFRIIMTCSLILLRHRYLLLREKILKNLSLFSNALLKLSRRVLWFKVTTRMQMNLEIIPQKLLIRKMLSWETYFSNNKKRQNVLWMNAKPWSKSCKLLSQSSLR